MSASIEQTEEFINRSRTHVDGWVSFYWGKTIEAHKAEGKLNEVLIGRWLQKLSAMSPNSVKDDSRWLSSMYGNNRMSLGR